MPDLFFDTSSLLRYPSGVPIYTLELLKEIIKQNSSFNIITGYCSSKKKHHDNLKKFLSNHNINIPFKQHNWPGRLAKFSTFQNKIKPQLCHNTDNFKLEWFRAKKNIVTVHDTYNLKHNPEKSKFFIKQSANCDAFITDSYFIKQELNTLIGENKPIYVCPIATQWTPNSDENKHVSDKFKLPEKPFFLSVGILHRRKNYPMMLQALQNLNTRHNKIQYVIVGAALPDSEPIIKAITSHPNVVWLPTCSSHTLNELYRNCIGFLAPSRYEGFGIPLLEAMSHSKACVYAKGSSMDELAEDNAIALSPDDTDAWTQKMCDIIEDKELSETLGAKAYKKSLHYNWSNTAKLTLQAYGCVLAS